MTETIQFRKELKKLVIVVPGVTSTLESSSFERRKIFYMLIFSTFSNNRKSVCMIVSLHMYECLTAAATAVWSL